MQISVKWRELINVKPPPGIVKSITEWVPRVSGRGFLFFFLPSPSTWDPFSSYPQTEPELTTEPARSPSLCQDNGWEEELRIPSVGKRGCNPAQFWGRWVRIRLLDHNFQTLSPKGCKNPGSLPTSQQESASACLVCGLRPTDHRVRRAFRRLLQETLSAETWLVTFDPPWNSLVGQAPGPFTKIASGLSR